MQLYLLELFFFLFPCKYKIAANVTSSLEGLLKIINAPNINSLLHFKISTKNRFSLLSPKHYQIVPAR